MWYHCQNKREEGHTNPKFAISIAIPIGYEIDAKIIIKLSIKIIIQKFKK